MKIESRKLIKFGNYSLCITLPKNIIDRFGLKKGDQVSLSFDANRLTINLKQKNKTTIKSGASKTRW